MVPRAGTLSPERHIEKLVPDNSPAYDSYLRAAKIEYNQIQTKNELLEKLNQQWDELRQSLDEKKLTEEQKLYEKLLEGLEGVVKKLASTKEGAELIEVVMKVKKILQKVILQDEWDELEDIKLDEMIEMGKTSEKPKVRSGIPRKGDLLNKFKQGTEDKPSTVMFSDEQEDSVLISQQWTIFNPNNAKKGKEILMMFDTRCQDTYVDGATAKELEVQLGRRTITEIRTFKSTDPMYVATSETTIALQTSKGLQIIKAKSVDDMSSIFPLIERIKTGKGADNSSMLISEYGKLELIIGMNNFFKFFLNYKKREDGMIEIHTTIGTIIAGKKFSDVGRQQDITGAGQKRQLHVFVDASATAYAAAAYLAKTQYQTPEEKQMERRKGNEPTVVMVVQSGRNDRTDIDFLRTNSCEKMKKTERMLIRIAHKEAGEKEVDLESDALPLRHGV
uniref:VWFA domain-containing protein n=1 Tax=Syphacia muris TaxID=451379 RepID=A0A0N5B1I3_9BILA